MWKDRYLVGIELIDNQHKELFKAMQILHLAIDNLTDINFKARCIDAIIYLKDYVVKHFHDEEQYMLSVNYMNFMHHKRMHTRLNTDLLMLESQLVESDFSIPVMQKFFGFIITWLTYHVAGEDQKIPKSIEADKAKVSTVINRHITTETMEKFAQSVKQVLKIVTDLADQKINSSIVEGAIKNPVICFQVGLLCAFDKLIILSYSDEIAKEIFMSMTGKVADSLNEMMVSTLSELSMIMGMNIAEVATLGGTVCDIEKPTRILYEDIPTEAQQFILSTSIGSIEIAIFDRT